MSKERKVMFTGEHSWKWTKARADIMTEMIVNSCNLVMENDMDPRMVPHATGRPVRPTEPEYDLLKSDYHTWNRYIEPMTGAEMASPIVQTVPAQLPIGIEQFRILRSNADFTVRSHYQNIYAQQLQMYKDELKHGNT